MIRKWHIKDFKAFKGDNSFRMAPVTVLAGANSAGKSSLIQSILLLSQTIRDTSTPYPAFDVSNDPRINLNGSYIKFGDFEDVINFITSSHQDNAEVSIGFETANLDVGRGRRSVHGSWSAEAFVSFRSQKNNPGDVYSLLHPKITRSKMRLRNTDIDEGPRYIDVMQKSKKVQDVESMNTLEAAEIQALQKKVHDLDEHTKNNIFQMGSRKLSHPRLIGASIASIFPDKILIKYEFGTIMADAVISAFIGTRTDFEALHIIRTMNDIYLSIARQTITSMFSLSKEAIEYVNWLLDKDAMKKRRVHPSEQSNRAEVRKYIRDNEKRCRRTLIQNFGKVHRVEFFSDRLIFEYGSALTALLSRNLRYLGPLRDDPKPVYPTGIMTDPMDIGIKGENTASVLNRFKEQTVSTVDPEGFLTDQFEIRLEEKSLENAVVSWLKYLGVANDYHTRDLGKLGHELRVQTTAGGRFHDLTNVGVGVSQVLPIVSLCLLAPKKSIIIIEQPELHLHPSVSGRLADFFIAVSKLGKQCILETHGQHIIERIRLRSVQEYSIIEDCAVHFMEHTGEGIKSREVLFNEYGGIIDWPNGFFDQSQKESSRLMELAAKKAKEKRQQ